MKQNTLTINTGNYQEYTDKYFLRTKQILEAEGINPMVRYQIFARKPGIVKGVDEAARFVKEIAGNKARVYALKNGMQYDSCEPLMKIEGRVQDLVELETAYLGIISGALTGPVDMLQVRQKARDIVKAAKGKPIWYMGARHFSPSLDEQIASICEQEGFAGASTDIGARAWNAKGMGTTPHALIISYAAYMDENKIKGNPTVEAAKAFDRNIDPAVPRIMLIDTFNREIQDSLETALAVPNLAGVRIDTCGENYAQTTLDFDLEKEEAPDLGEVTWDKYQNGKGVTIEAVWALRSALVRKGLGKLDQVVSSGFNADKTASFVNADIKFREKYGFPLFTSIGTGSIANPVMAPSDIVAYRTEKGEWKEMHKVGRPEIETKRLEEIK